MRKAEIVIITLVLIALFAVATIEVVGHKTYHYVKDGHCTNQPTLVLVPLDDECDIAFEFRDCNETNRPTNCRGKRLFSQKMKLLPH